MIVDDFYKKLNAQLDDIKQRMAIDDEKFERLKEISRNLGYGDHSMQSKECQEAATM